MDNLGSNNNLNGNQIGKKNFKYAKMRFTELKGKIVKKTANEAEKSEDKTDNKENEKLKKLIRDKEIYQIENELDNKRLLLKVMDSDTVTDHIDDFFSREGHRSNHHDKEGAKNEEIPVTYNEDLNKKEPIETLDEFWKKYRNFNETVRKGNMKTMTPSYGFIKSSQENFLIPNPIGLLSRNGESNSIGLRNQKVGDDYIKALSQGLLFADNIKKLDLASNRLTTYGVNPLFKSINENKKLQKGIRILDLSYNKIGDQGLEKIINYIIDDECNLEELSLEGNSLGDKNINRLGEVIISDLADKITCLNISKNLISDESCVSIANLLQHCLNMKILMLSWNHIKNFGASLMINKLKKNNEMKVLDLSWNSIGNSLNEDATVEDVVKGQKPERDFFNFEILDFRKNTKLNFRSELIPQKKEGKKDPKAPKIPDVNPFESIKSHKQVSAFAKELGEYFKEQNTELIHLDISHNNISSEDAIFLSNECKANHKILGLHVDGNEITIDELGFLHPLKKLIKNENYYAHSQIYYNIGNENGNFLRTNNEKVRRIRAKNNCWICEGWREIPFIYRPDKSMKNLDRYTIKIHLSFENWKPYDTILKDGIFKCIRMCPPGEIFYFFTVDKNPVDSYGVHFHELREPIVYEFDDEYIKEYNENLIKVNYLERQENPEAPEEEKEENENAENVEVEEAQNEEQILKQKEEEEDKKAKENAEAAKRDERRIEVKYVGKINVEVNDNVINDKFQNMLKYCEARPERKLNKFVKPRTPWTYPISIWASYYELCAEGEKDEYLRDVFEHDFARCQMNNFIKNEEMTNEIKKILRSNFKKILDCYRTLSAYLGSSIWQITENTLKEFFQGCNGLIDLKVYNINGILLQARAVKANPIDMTERVKNKNKNIPDNIIRHQFMSLLVRIAKDKYVTQLGSYTSIYEAVAYTFENHYLSEMKSFDAHSWRVSRYYNEFVDNYLKSHLPYLDALYKSWAPRKDPGKRDTWMILEEFTTLMSNFIDADFPIRDLPVLFINSMRIQIDEIESDRHYNMTFPEFLEAFCRVIDKASPIPLGEKPEDWPQLRRNEQTLAQKLENVTLFIVKNITNPEYKIIKEKLSLPIKEEDTGLYSWDSNLSYYSNLCPVNKKEMKRK